jgi:NAD(P)H-dependent FMN reductase
MLLLYGSLRARFYSRFSTFEAARLLEDFGADSRIFDTSGLPLPDDAPEGHPKVAELRELSARSEAQVSCSPERHGAMTGVLKAQLSLCPSPQRLKMRKSHNADKNRGHHTACPFRGSRFPRGAFEAGRL